MRLTKINNFIDYLKYRDTNQTFHTKIQISEENINKQLAVCDEIYLKGYSWPDQSESEFLVDKLYSNNDKANLRERLVCQKTGLNNRTRGNIHIFEESFKSNKNDAIYLTEQCTLLGKWMQQKYPYIQCSEYLTDCSTEKKAHLQDYVMPHKLKHQDLTSLTYENKTFDYILSYDCFEHIPDYKAAFKECFRVLKHGGTLMWSVPFNRNRYRTLIRARLKQDDTIEHLTEPEYHGDPTSEKGCLSYYTFGWELLDDLRLMGFSNTYALFYWSEKYAYLGPEQTMLCASK
jgi:SAM-dependent methyltransferase